MPKEISTKAVSQPEAQTADSFQKGDLVKRASGLSGKVLARVPYRNGDSHKETYIVEGMVGAIPVEVLSKVE